MRPILCVDFDGVIHSYTSGWQGANVVSDLPVPGAIEFLREAVKHFQVAIFSSRSHQPGGIFAMKEWLGLAGNQEPWLDEISWPTTKPAAFLTIDDRAILFEGTWPTMEGMLNFKPWNKK